LKISAQLKIRLTFVLTEADHFANLQGFVKSFLSFCSFLQLGHTYAEPLTIFQVCETQAKSFDLRISFTRMVVEKTFFSSVAKEICSSSSLVATVAAIYQPLSRHFS